MLGFGLIGMEMELSLFFARVTPFPESPIYDSKVVFLNYGPTSMDASRSTQD